MLWQVILEGLAVCMILLICCVVGIANGAVNCVFLYDKQVQERAVQNGLITPGKIKRNQTVFKICGMTAMLLFTLIAVYGCNGARGFAEGYRQLVVIFLMEGLFDRLFIDFFWVEHTKAWTIPGTEDLMPYIPKKQQVQRLIATLIGYPLMAAVPAALMSLIFK